MKKILLVLAFVLFLTACGEEVETPNAPTENGSITESETEYDAPEFSEEIMPPFEDDGPPFAPPGVTPAPMEIEPEQPPVELPVPDSSELTSDPPTPAIPPTAEPLRVVTTIFPQYDFVRQITGGRVELSMLISPGAESHGFEPTARDMVAIGQADLLVHVGGGKDDWVTPILASVGRTDMPTAALLDMVEAIVVMHTEDCDDEECDFPHHVAHYDEHVWTCPRNAVIIVNALTNVLSEKDPANAVFFRTNAAAFVSELQALDRAFIEVIQNGVRNTIIFGDRFPFRYFVETYGLTHLAAFEGCCVDTQVSPVTIASIINRVTSENIPVVFYIELSNRLIANTIAEETGARLLELHSAHNVSPADFNAGITYLEIMRRNVEHLREALS